MLIQAAQALQRLALLHIVKEADVVVIEVENFRRSALFSVLRSSRSRSPHRISAKCACTLSCAQLGMERDSMPSIFAFPTDFHEHGEVEHVATIDINLSDQPSGICRISTAQAPTAGHTLMKLWSLADESEDIVQGQGVAEPAQGFTHGGCPYLVLQLRIQEEIHRTDEALKSIVGRLQPHGSFVVRVRQSVDFG